MKLHEIIEINSEDKKSVLIELMVPYKRSLKTYFENEFNTTDLIMMVTSVTNATSYGKIVPAGEFMDAIMAWMDEPIDFDNEDSDSYIEYETICANSLPLDRL